MSDTKLYPSEVIDLPSKGLFYPENSPLRSGQIELKYMTAKEEDILSSRNLIEKNIVLDKLLDSLILTPGVKSSDLLVGDINAAMVATRILAYGKDYPVTVVCPNCGSEIEEVADLTQLNTKNEPTEATKKEFTVVLPVSKAEVKLKLLTRKDEHDVDKEIKSLKKASLDVSNESTARLRAIIVSVNGDASRSTVWNFVENMLVRDSRFIKEQYKKLLPDIDLTIKVACTCGDDPVSVRLPIGQNFFWPDA
jgi:uncharacterized Zn finger protein (UPF0148 family)